MRKLAVVLAATAAAIAPAQGQSSNEAMRAAAIVDAVANLCPVHANPAALSGGAIVTGPPPGTHHSSTTIGGEQMSVVYRPEPGGFCAVRFQPASAAAIEAELARRFQAEANRDQGGAAFLVRRPDGDARVVYTPYVGGRTGPQWLRTRNGYAFGFNAAESKDRIIVYFP